MQGVARVPRKLQGQLGFDFDTEPEAPPESLPFASLEAAAGREAPAPGEHPRDAQGRRQPFWTLAYVEWWESLPAHERLTEGLRLNTLIEQCAKRAKEKQRASEG